MLFAYRVTAGQEGIVADLLYEKIKKTHSGINALVVSPRLKGYLISEAPDELEAKKVITNVPHVKGILRQSMDLSEIKEMLEAKPAETNLEKDMLIEITAGPFKGEKAKVVRINKEKDEVTVELVEVAVPIPVTIKIDTVKVLPK
ncbi:transcription elongation factor Spt5 [Candidatus Micrarchaeota archaeon]|nr:transcription elongation factor Spt5 [Candidatus Micrarchaeota archaeon]MBI5177405.1 transcription elongation factor Spt5 [Candidatus Micrarchaeota archaeon]